MCLNKSNLLQNLMLTEAALQHKVPVYEWRRVLINFAKFMLPVMRMLNATDTLPYIICL